MKLRRMLALTLVLMTLMTAPALAENHSGFYQPQENAAMDYDDSESRWSFARSAESEHFLLFWEAGFGENPLNAAPEMQGRVFGLLGIVMALAMPAGMAVFGPLADVVSVEVVLIVGGVVTVLVGLVIRARAPEFQPPGQPA